MKIFQKINIFSMMILALIVFFAQFQMNVSEAAPVRKRLMILPVQSRSYPELARIAEAKLTSELLKHKAFDIVERKKMESILDEQGFSSTALVDQESAISMGKLLSAQYTLIASVDDATRQTDVAVLGLIGGKRSGTTVRMSFRLVDNTTGQLVLAETTSGTSTRGGVLTIGVLAGSGNAGAREVATERAIDQFMEKFKESYPIIGTIVAISGKDVYIDIGREHGVRVGQEYTVFTEGRPVVSRTGKIIGVTRTEHGRLKIKSVEEEMAIGKVDFSAQEGMLVKLFKNVKED